MLVQQQCPCGCVKSQLTFQNLEARHLKGVGRRLADMSHKGGVASVSQLLACLSSVKAHIEAKAHAARWKKYSLKQSTLQDTSQQG